MSIYKIRYKTLYKDNLIAYVMARDSLDAIVKLSAERGGFDSVSEVVSVDLHCSDVVFVN